MEKKVTTQFQVVPATISSKVGMTPIPFMDLNRTCLRIPYCQEQPTEIRFAAVEDSIELQAGLTTI